MKQVLLHIPVGFELPDIYRTTTAEENFLILSAGMEIIKTVRSSNFGAVLDTLNLKLEDEKASVKKLNGILMASTSSIAGAIESVLNDGLGIMEASLEDRIKKLMTNDYSNNIQKLEEKLNSMSEYLQRLHETAKLFEVKDKNSSIRGRDNESISKQLIIDNFALPGMDFNLEQKEYYSGDHIFSWCGLKIMWEDKNYERTIPKDQVEKAYRDLNYHNECSVLVFVSANSGIKDHENSTGLDVEIYNGKLILFISHFRSHPDPNLYIRGVIQPIIMGYKPYLMDNSCFNDTTIASRLKAINSILPTILKDFNEREKDIDETISKLAIMKAKMVGSRNTLNDLFENLNYNNQEEINVQRSTRTCGACGETGHTRKTCVNVPRIVINK